jgi:hypothetical protein
VGKDDPRTLVLHEQWWFHNIHVYLCFGTVVCCAQFVEIFDILIIVYLLDII